MGVYIRGMEMPTGHPLWIVVHSDGTVEANEVSQSRPVGWQTLRNAAVPVPPHGRLGDLDALHKLFLEKAKEYKGVGGAMVAMAALCIANAPTIIPAEPAEEG